MVGRLMAQPLPFNSICSIAGECFAAAETLNLKHYFY